MNWQHNPRRRTWGQRFDDWCFFYLIPALLVFGLGVIGWQLWQLFQTPAL